MLRLLIADDDPVSRKLVEKQGRNLDFKVFAAENGKEAMDTFKTKKINVAILDWMMPEMTGIEVCEQIRKGKTKEYQYIILLTSRNNPQDIIKGLNIGADDYITKPFDLKELEARLNIGRRIMNLQKDLLRAQQKLYKISIHDNLTNLNNRKEILRNLEEKFNQSKREGQFLGIIMLDIDHFKKINDHYGHQTGDMVLTEMAKRLKTGLRPYDKVGRYGGEEFLIVLPNCNQDTTRKIAERIRREIAKKGFASNKGKLKVTISMGCTVTGQSEKTTVEALINRSDIALYKAKSNGRNRVCVG